jgi:hypothetical protein
MTLRETDLAGSEEGRENQAANLKDLQAHLRVAFTSCRSPDDILEMENFLQDTVISWHLSKHIARL